jgi:MFS family permease
MTVVQHARRPLGAPFRIFQSAVLISDLADGVYKITLPLLALGLHDPAFAVVAVGVAIRAPWILVTLPAGVIIDRHDPLTVMRWFSLARLPIVAALCGLALSGSLATWSLVVGAFAIGSCGTFVDIAAQSLLPRLVEPDALPRANANLQTGQTVMAQFLGPAVGGLIALLAGAGIGAAAALYLVTLAGFEFLRRRRGGHATKVSGRSLRSMTTELREGAAHFVRSPDIVCLALVAAAGNLAFAATTTVLPLWVVAPGPLGLSEQSLGLVVAAPAVGGLAAGLFAARVVQRFGGRRVLAVCAPAVGLSFVAIAVPHVVVIAVALAVYGALAVFLNVTNMSHRQSTIPQALFGRVNAAYRWVVLGVSPLGAALGGLLASWAGPPTAFIGTGAVAILAGVFLAARAPSFTDLKF